MEEPQTLGSSLFPETSNELNSLNSLDLFNGVLNIITLIVVIYSIYYLHGEKRITSYLIQILIFKFGMYVLINSNNLYFTLIGWEIIGILSFSLISFWNTSHINIKSALKAFITNKIGDISFFLYLIWENPHSEVKASFLILAALVKCAQFLFHGWLSDAMAGPTPVSALLHASTMVIAGVILLIKNREEVNLFLSNVYIFWTLLTIIISGLIAYNQFDLKRIIAFSTCAQVGLMLFSQYNLYVSYNHLISHAFFKALLFLLAGFFIHLGGYQDIRRSQGGTPTHYLSSLFLFLFFISSLTLAGLPTTSGFFSKEGILFSTLQFNTLGLFIFIIIASITSNLYNLHLFTWLFKTRTSLLVVKEKSLRGLLSVLTLFILFYYTMSTWETPYSFNSDLTLFEFFLEGTNLLPFIIIIPFLVPYLKGIEFPKRIQLYFLFGLNRKFYIDTIYNYYLIYPIWSISFKYIFFIIEKGWLEYRFRA